LPAGLRLYQEGAVKLTRYERELVRAVLSGSSIAAMALHLDVSRDKLKDQLGALYVKFGVRTRQQLAIVAIQRDDV
jgi:DNA-binding CsgD family transcriptional regulator